MSCDGLWLNICACYSWEMVKIVMAVIFLYCGLFGGDITSSSKRWPIFFEGILFVLQKKSKDNAFLRNVGISRTTHKPTTCTYRRENDYKFTAQIIRNTGKMQWDRVLEKLPFIVIVNYFSVFLATLSLSPASDSWLAYSWILKIEAIFSSETSGSFRTTRRYILKGGTHSTNY
jgi:hypothetical protein